ncbi:preprotein translocase subunit YajC [Streptomyces zagrosensis]|uniref:Preprotein translocase subunit YajC n=1 Tax=Streptomyces zagrosensis TaxID=1042984 RepID=A0A7W9QAD9_9ACTN|nr:preprotein translocase subunit YajC [Streptomyces zagrosensis]MBB5935622.1 preprotein translocase subunit YajC [Streptomyces zagrosensis]
MNIVTLLPFVVLIGAMFLMTRSAKNKQRQAAQMRDQIQPGTGVRTIGGMYATVKEVHDDTMLLEVAPGVHAIFARNSVGAVLDDAEYNRIVHGIEAEQEDDAPVVPDDASSLTEAEGDNDRRVDMTKGDASDEVEKTDAADQAGAAEPADAADADATEPKDAKPEDSKRSGDSDAK